jgi:preprotein translocase subunit SecA
LQFDDVLNTQREVIYGIRNEAVQSDTPRDIIYEMIEEELDTRLESLAGDKDGDAMDNFLTWLNAYFPIALKREDISGQQPEEQHAVILERIKGAYQQREQFESKEALEGLERYIVIRSLDRRWQDHLTEMEELRRSVNLRSYGQKDPLSEYKSEAYGFFEELMTSVRTEICNAVFRTATNQEAFQNMLARMSRTAQVAGPGTEQSSDGAAAVAAPAERKQVELPKVEPIRRELPKLGRNDTVTIRKDGETKELKFKKAEAMIHNEGWDLVQK